MPRTLLFFIFGLLWLAPAPAAPLKVMVDPGHGGTDDGAVRVRLREADIVLSISQKLHALLEDSPNFHADLTRREAAKSLTLKERVELAENFKADLFLSIHANASTDSRVRGAEFYFSPALSAHEASLWMSHLSVQAQKELASPQSAAEPTSDLSIILHEIQDQHRAWESQELSRSLFHAWGSTKRVVRQAPFYVVNSNSVPAVLVEVGYLSNAKERELLTRPEYQQKIAEQIFQGLELFKEFMDKSQKSNLQ